MFCEICDSPDHCEHNSVQCEECHEWVYNEDAEESASGDAFCRDCYATRFTVCEWCSCEIDTEYNDVLDFHGTTYCEDCFSENFDRCDCCGEYHFVEDIQYHDGNTYCQSCFDEEFCHCTDCGW